MIRHMLTCVLSAAMICGSVGCLHPRPVEPGNEIVAPSPTPALPYHVDNMHIQTMGPITILYSSMRISFDNLPEPATQKIADLLKLASTGKIHPAAKDPYGRCPLFIYHDPSEDPAAPFDLDIGIPIDPTNTLESDVLTGYLIKTLPKFHCATAIYRGPMKFLPKAYDKLIPEMIAAGMIPSDETRERYLIWESPDSPNNVVQIEVGIR